MKPTANSRENSRPKRVGLKDVAREAGVDVSTVSRIINGNASLYAEETRENVLEAAAKLNYRPNAAARGMATGSSRMVGVTISGEGYLGRIVSGINEALLERGHLMLHAWNPETFVTPDHPLQKRIIHELVERQVEGVILRVGSEEFERAYFEEILQRGIPMIVVDREMALFKTDFVGSDDVRIGIDAASHLVELGHRRLLFIGEREKVSTARLREQGFREVVSETPDAVCRKIEIDLDDSDWDEMLARALTADDRPTGVFCYSDRMAPAVYRAAARRGLAIPADLSVIGCGNMAWGEYLTPALTTFDQRPEDIGREAVRLYLDRVSEKKEPSVPRAIRVEGELVSRGSTAPVSE